VKVGMLFPHREKCGIAIFSREVVHALRQAGAEVVTIDSDAPVKQILGEVHRCDLLHVQYETGLYMRGKRDVYRVIMRQKRIPAVVSLHEVYEVDPFVYPRAAIRGWWCMAALKKIVWDMRHRVQCVAASHCRHNYYATELLFFYRFQKEILRIKGTSVKSVSVIEKPVPPASDSTSFRMSILPAVNLCIIGFINPSYDIDLLFGALEALERPWTCTWIGGAPSETARGVAAEIDARIRAHKWENCFFLTGWVSQQELDAAIKKQDIVLSLFKARSTSDSITRAMGYRKPVIASPLPLTEEIARGECGDDGITNENKTGPILLCDGTARSVASLVDRIATDELLRQRLFTALCHYNEVNSWSSYASRVITLYDKTGAR